MDDSVKLEDLDPTAAGPALDDPDDPRVLARVQEFLEELESLIDAEHVQYARETLEDIYETVRRTMRMSAAQRRAVGNIDEGGRRHR